MVGAGVSVKLVLYSQTGQFAVQLNHVLLGWIGVYFTKVEEDWAFYAPGELEGAFVCPAHRNHDVPAVMRHGCLEMGIGGGCQPGCSPALAKAGDPQAIAVNGGMAPGKLHRRIDVGDDFGVV